MMRKKRLANFRINGHDVPARQVHWLGDRLCVDLDESTLSEIKPLLAQKELTIETDQQTFSGWISMQLSYGYLEIRKEVPGNNVPS